MEHRMRTRLLAVLAPSGTIAAATVVTVLAATRVGAQTTGPQWRALPGPGPTYGWTALLDPPRERVVFHGGETEEASAPDPARLLSLDPLAWGVWAEQGDVPKSSRSGRGLLGSPAVADRAEETVLAVCDCLSAGTYEMHLADDRWTAIETDIVRNLDGPNLVYDAGADRAIVFGGREYGITDILTATYAYDLSSARRGWSPLPSVPFQLQNQAVAVDPGSGLLLAVGGQDGAGNPGDDLWSLDLARAHESGAWTVLSPRGPTPPARIGASLTFVRDGMAILYGGYADAHHLDDAWLLDVSDLSEPLWVQLAVSGQVPPPRAAHAAVWDPDGQRLIVSGGITGDNWNLTVLGDAWALYLDNAPPPTSTAATPTASGTPPPAVPAFLPAALRRAPMP